jgi:3-dehydroquinate synthase
MNQIRTVPVATFQNPYSVFIGPCTRSQLTTFLTTTNHDSRIVIITDTTVAKLHLPQILKLLPSAPLTIEIPPGEEQKSNARALAIYDDLAHAHIARSDLILALGGGVVGDLAGFVAATWMRGLPFIQLPTTLLAAIDASIGGKTGINHPAGKNLIGAFHQPAAVIVDTEFLSTLDERDYVAGLAESVKHAAVRDAAFLEWHKTHAERIRARDAELLPELIERNCRIKAAVVAADEREADLRMILNHGHTIGHAIEHLLDYELRHGECVALGMIVENEIAVRRGMLPREAAARVAALLARLGLPTRLPLALASERIAEATHLDKKLRGGNVNFVLLSAIGSPARVADVTDEEIFRAAECHTNRRSPAERMRPSQNSG